MTDSPQQQRYDPLPQSQRGTRSSQAEEHQNSESLANTHSHKHRELERDGER